MKPGDVLGDRFELIGELGRGGMATVWMADDRTLGERIALELLHPHLADDPGARARLLREVRAATRIRHDNVLLPREVHELDGQIALSMPLHQGRNLADLVAATGPLGPEALRRLALELSGALAEAHRQGVVHRDLTPNNVLIDDSGHADLVDFGLARLDDAASGTATAVAGTWGYAAPETFEGSPAGPRSDLYSLGAVLWFAATGAPPFSADNPAAILRQQLEASLPSLAERCPDLSVALTTTIDAMLQRDPGSRPAGATDVHDALTANRPLPPAPAVPARQNGAEHAGELAPGLFTVVVGGRRGEAGRRLKLKLRRGPIQPSEDADPERALAAAVSRERGEAPPTELPAAMRRGEFKLVEGVDKALAERLANEAVRAGMLPRIVDDPQVRYSINVHKLTVAGVLMAATATGLLVTASGLGATSHTIHVLFWWILASIAVAVVGRFRQRLQIAFPRVRSRAEPAPLAASPEPQGHLARVHHRTQAQLDALAAALDAAGSAGTRGAGTLPPQAIVDLRGTVASLREHASELVERATRLQAESARTLLAADDAGRIQARLRRLKTLEHAGTPADPAELRSLEAALSQLQAQRLASDHAEALETLVSARLLEIGAAADTAARAIRGDDTLGGSAQDLLEGLVEQSQAARAAARELA